MRVVDRVQICTSTSIFGTGKDPIGVGPILLYCRVRSVILDMPRFNHCVWKRLGKRPAKKRDARNPGREEAFFANDQSIEAKGASRCDQHVDQRVPACQRNG